MSELVVGRLHESVAALAFLLGRWRGEGEGGYPGFEPFRYGEEMSFEHVGDAFLLYSQASWLLGDGSPLHFERGFFRPGDAPGTIELTLAHPLGLSEVSQGTIDGQALRLASRSVTRTATGSAVVGIERRYNLDGDVLRYSLDMSMDETPMARHLDGELRRVSA